MTTPTLTFSAALMRFTAYLVRRRRARRTCPVPFTPKRSLVRSQYRPPAQTPPPDLGRGRLTTDSDNNAGAWVRASAISYCRGRPLHGHLTGGRRTSSPTTAREQAEPWRRCLVTLLGGVPGQIRRTGLGRRPITGSRLRPLLRQGPHRTGRPTGCPSDDGGRAGIRFGPRRVTAGNRRERRGTAGNSREQQGTAGNSREQLGGSPGRSPRSVGRSAGRQVGPGCTALGNSAPAHWRSPLRRRRNRHLIVGGRRPRSRCRRTSWRCPDLHGHARSTGWPVESAALSARPVAVVNVDGPGYEPSPVPAAGLADGEPLMLGLPKPASAPMSSPRSVRRRLGASLETTEASAPSCDR